jgi:hypothetical protein
MFGPFKVQYCLPNNIVILISINNFEPNLILVNINKLKPYTYVDKTLKGIQSLKDQKFLLSIGENHMEKNLMKIQKIIDK